MEISRPSGGAFASAGDAYTPESIQLLVGPRDEVWRGAVEGFVRDFPVRAGVREPVVLDHRPEWIQRSERAFVWIVVPLLTVAGFAVVAVQLWRYLFAHPIGG